MIELNFRNVTKEVIGEDNGLDIKQEFDNYQEIIYRIIADLIIENENGSKRLL